MICALIAAVAANNAIGYQNKLLYWLPADLQRFKRLTTGHTIVMGHNTFRSLPNGALPNRRNIVLTHDAALKFTGAECCSSLKEALARCAAEDMVFVIGGAMVYEQALRCADRLYITHVEDTPAAADCFFPTIDPAEWMATAQEHYEADEKHAYAYSFVTYQRK